MRWVWIALGIGCANGSPPGADSIAVPHVVALSTYSASLGVTIEAYGRQFSDASLGRTELDFEGFFERADGQVEPVRLTAEARRVDEGTLRWSGFGPYRVPFGASGDTIGTFRGTVGARLVTKQGKAINDPEPAEVEFTVGPSLIVHELEPAAAACNGAIQRGLGNVPYRLRVEALGFTPTTYTYTISAPSLDTDTIALRHLAHGRFDLVQAESEFRFPPVPDDAASYTAVVTIEALAEDGQTYRSAFSTVVHRPLEIFYNGNVVVAEIYDPVPVSGCIPGGFNGRTVQYSEINSEVLNRSKSVGWDESWVRSHTVARGSSTTIGESQINGVGFSTTDTENWNWSVGGEAGGSVSLGKLVELGMKGNFGRDHGQASAATNNTSRTQGLDREETSTETEATEDAMGGSQGESFEWSVGSSESIGQTFEGDVIARSFGVFYRQTIRLLRRAAVVAYNQCGHATVVADVDFVDWAWSPDLALGNECPPLPQSSLPPAQCLVSPCGALQ